MSFSPPTQGGSREVTNRMKRSTKKRCSRCRQNKSPAEFWRDRDKKDGLKSQCKECTLEMRAGDEKREKRLAQMRRRNLRKFYGITPELFDLLVAAQGGACAICELTPTDSLHVDHDHSREGIAATRGALCRRCNTQLGIFERLCPCCVARLPMFADPDRRRAFENYLANPPARRIDLVGWATRFATAG